MIWFYCFSFLKSFTKQWCIFFPCFSAILFMLMRWCKADPPFIRKITSNLSKTFFFSLYFQRFAFGSEEEEVYDNLDQVDVFPKQLGDRFLLKVEELQLKLQANVSDDGMLENIQNVRCFSILTIEFVLFSFYFLNRLDSYFSMGGGVESNDYLLYYLSANMTSLFFYQSKFSK